GQRLCWRGHRLREPGRAVAEAGARARARAPRRDRRGGTDRVRLVGAQYSQLRPIHDNRSIRPGLAGRQIGPDATRDTCSMASPNLDLVRSIYAAWERGNRSSFEWADPEIEVVVADGASPGRWSGLTGMAQGTRDILSAWEEHRELDDEHVLVLTRYCGRGKKSGLELGQK